MKEKDFDIIENIKKCSFTEGDIIFVNTKDRLPNKVCNNIQRYLEGIISVKVRVVISPYNFEVSVLTEGGKDES